MSRTLRILYHHRTLGEGAEGIHINAMIDAFRSLGHEVRVVSLIAAGARPEAERGRRLGRLVQRLPRAFYEAAEIAYNVKGYLAVASAVNGFRPDFIYDRYNLYNDSAVAAARRRGVPVFLEVNTPYAYQRRIWEKLAFPGLASWTEARTWRRADRVFVVSTPLQQYVLERGVPPDRVEVTPNGVDSRLFDPLRWNGEPAPDPLPRVGFVGSLRHWHGLEYLIEAALPLLRPPARMRLIVVGDGPARPEIEARTRAMGVADVVDFLGHVSHERIPSVIAGFHVAVSPRNVFYQSPMKILEYMAMARAVVAPDTENVRDLVDPDREAILFRPDDPGSLRAALERLIADPALRRTLGAAARRRVVERHSWKRNAERVIACWEAHAAAGESGH